MGSFLDTNIEDKPTTNFQINTGTSTKLKKPYGTFVEKLMYTINLELTSIGLSAFQFFIYDAFNPDVGVPPGWTLDSDTDCIRKSFTPAPPFTQLLGFKADIHNYLTDIATADKKLFDEGWVTDLLLGIDDMYLPYGFSTHSGTVDPSFESVIIEPKKSTQENVGDFGNITAKVLAHPIEISQKTI